MKEKIYNLRRRLARYAKILLGRDIYIARNTVLPLKRYGDSVGGWDLCPAGLKQDSIVYSFGVGTNISFDLAVIAKYQLVVHCFDPSPQSIEYMAAGQWPESLVFHPWGIGRTNTTIDFFKPSDKRLGSLSLVGGEEFETVPIPCEIRRLDDIMRTLGHQHIDVLKMDVEGAEYEVLESLTGMTGIRIDQILVEFHHRFSRISTAQTRAAVKQMRSLGYKLISVSASGRNTDLLMRRISIVHNSLQS